VLRYGKQKYATPGAITGRVNKNIQDFVGCITQVAEIIPIFTARKRVLVGESVATIPESLAFAT